MPLSARAARPTKASDTELEEFRHRGPRTTSQLRRYPGSISDLIIALFVISTVALPDGHLIVLASRLLILSIFFFGIISGKSVIVNSFFLSSGFFLLLCSVSLFWSVSPETSAARVYNLAYNYASLFALANIIKWKPERLDFCITWIVISALAGCAYAFLIQGVTFQDTREIDGVTASGQLAFACAAGIAISISRLSSRFKQRYLIATFLLFSFMFFTSGRRGLMIATTFILIFQFLEPQWSARKFWKVAGVVLVLFAGYTTIMSVPVFYSYIGYRLDAFIAYVITGEITDASISGRGRLIQLGYGWFTESPYIGHGIDSFRALFSETHGSWSTSADNNYIELMTGLGLVGLFSYYGPLLVFLVAGFSSQRLRRSPAPRFALAFIVSMSLLDFSNVWIFSKVGILMLLLCYLLVRREVHSIFVRR